MLSFILSYVQVKDSESVLETTKPFYKERDSMNLVLYKLQE